MLPRAAQFSCKTLAGYQDISTGDENCVPKTCWTLLACPRVVRGDIGLRAQCDRISVHQMGWLCSKNVAKKTVGRPEEAHNRAAHKPDVSSGFANGGDVVLSEPVLRGDGSTGVVLRLPVA